MYIIVVTFFNVHTVYVSFYIKIVSEGTFIIYLFSYSIKYKSPCGLLLCQTLTRYHNSMCNIVRDLNIIIFSHVVRVPNSYYENGQ